MSLTDLHAEVEECRNEAGRLTEEFTQVHSQVETDPSLTPDGKRERLQPLHTDIVNQLKELRAREKAAVKTEKERLERRVYGLSPTASNDPARLVSYRDAQSRARQLDDADDAKDIYETALRSGDNVLATAILERALIRGWSDIKADYLSRSPQTREDLDDLEALAKYADNSFASVVHYMPPSLNLPHSAGMPNVPSLHSRAEPRAVRPLPAGFGTGQ